MSNNLRKTLEHISRIRLVPLREASILEFFPDKDLTFNLRDDLDDYGMHMGDRVQDIFDKYINLHKVDPEIVEHLNFLID